MEITKDLFYSCLSGELTGYFILRNNNRIHSECLSLVNYNMIQTTVVSEYTFLLSNLTQTMGFLHTAYNEYGQNQCSRDYDIVDFEGKTYAMLLPMDEENEEDPELIVLEYIEEGEEGFFQNIEDEEEFDRVCEYIESLADSVEE